MDFLLVVAALVVGAPLAAAVLVTLASHREDSAHSLAGRPPGLLAAAARALLCLRTAAAPTRGTRLSAPASTTWPEIHVPPTGR